MIAGFQRLGDGGFDLRRVYQGGLSRAACVGPLPNSLAKQLRKVRVAFGQTQDVPHSAIREAQGAVGFSLEHQCFGTSLVQHPYLSLRHSLEGGGELKGKRLGSPANGEDQCHTRILSGRLVKERIKRIRGRRPRQPRPSDLVQHVEFVQEENEAAMLPKRQVDLRQEALVKEVSAVLKSTWGGRLQVGSLSDRVSKVSQYLA